MTYPKPTGNKPATVLGITFTSDSKYIGRHRPAPGRTSANRFVLAYGTPTEGKPQSGRKPEVA